MLRGFQFIGGMPPYLELHYASEGKEFVAQLFDVNYGMRKSPYTVGIYVPR